MTDPKWPHGTLSGYTNQRCRCEDCRAAWAAYHVDYVAKRRWLGLPPGHRAHGTRGGYINYGCRCDACRAADAAYQRARARRRP